MSTPPRLCRLVCSCGSAHWEIDSDFRGIDGREASYDERTYECPECGYRGPGFMLREQSPPEFFLQPHSRDPMPRSEFDDWVEVLRTNFPDHPRLADSAWLTPSATPNRLRRLWSRLSR